MNFTSSILLAGASWSLLAFALIVPLLMGADPAVLVIVSAFVVGVQASQSSTVQVAPPGGTSRRLWLELATVGAATALAAIGASTSSSLASSVGGTVAGALIGIALGKQSLVALRTGGGLRYQSFQAIRSALIVLGVVVMSSVWRESAPLAAGLLALTVGLPSLLVRQDDRDAFHGQAPLAGSGETAAVKPHMWVLVGLIASLYYRNDVTWIRSSLVDAPNFDAWNIGLVIYTATQGLLGFLIVQRIYARREVLRPRFEAAVKRYWLIAIPGWLILSSGFAAVAWNAGIASAITLSVILTVGVGLMSSGAHIANLNGAAYLAGVIGVSVLLVLLGMEVAAGFALVVQNGVIGLVLLTILARKVIGR